MVGGASVLSTDRTGKVGPRLLLCGVICNKELVPPYESIGSKVLGCQTKKGAEAERCSAFMERTLVKNPLAEREVILDTLC